VVALLFMEHGLAKLLHFPVPQPGVTGPLPPLLLAAAIIEIVAGGLIVLGLFTRLARSSPRARWRSLISCSTPAGLLADRQHGRRGDPLLLRLLYLAAAGPGAWSLDGMRTKSVPVSNLRAGCLKRGWSHSREAGCGEDLGGIRHLGESIVERREAEAHQIRRAKVATTPRAISACITA